MRVFDWLLDARSKGGGRILAVVLAITLALSFFSLAPIAGAASATETSAAQSDSAQESESVDSEDFAKIEAENGSKDDAGLETEGETNAEDASADKAARESSDGDDGEDTGALNNENPQIESDVEEQVSSDSSETEGQDEASAEAVAKIGDATYTTLQAAIEAAQPQDVVVMQANIEGMISGDIINIGSDKVVTLDMAGHSITVSADFVGRPIANKGTLTVMGNGTIDASNGSSGYGAIRNDGTLTIQNGNYIGNVYGDGAAIRNGIGSKLTIHGGVLCLYRCCL